VTDRILGVFVVSSLAATVAAIAVAGIAIAS
jgi:hypothetical protein